LLLPRESRAERATITRASKFCKGKEKPNEMSKSKIRLSLLLIGAAMASVAQGQNASQPQPSPSRIDLFAGYSYWQANGSAGGVSFSNANLGVLISGAYYLDRNIGIELAGDYHFTGGNDSMRSLSIGPIVRAQPYHGFTPFVHALAGATNMLGPGAFYDYHDAPQSATWGRQLTLGGGVDYSLPYFHHHLGLRLFQADYVIEHVDFGAGGLADFNSGRFSTGLLWRSGSVPPPPPVTLACTATPQSVFVGDRLSVIGVATNLDPRKKATFHWIGHGVSMNESEPIAEIDTAGLNPGVYKVGGHVSEGNRAGQSADCTAAYTVISRAVVEK
jgi:hypothetical protein